jgi:sugar lactone lactonase YvrE
MNDRIVEWKSNAKNGRVVASGNAIGDQTNQLRRPIDVIIDAKNDCFIIADNRNRRVIRRSRQNNTNGEIIINDIDCEGLTMDNNGYLYVSDYEKNEVRRWKKGDEKETIVAGGNGQGNHLNQLDRPTYIFVDQDYSLYVSDGGNDRVMKWLKDATEGIVVAGGNGKGDSFSQLSFPKGVIVDHYSQIYVADMDNHRVMRWSAGDTEGTIVVGGNGGGKEADQLFCPVGLSFDKEGNLYVADVRNNRIQKFEIDSKTNNLFNRTKSKPTLFPFLGF